MKPLALNTLEEQIAPEHTALLVIDPQNDFCSSEGAVVRLMGWDPSRIQAAVPRLNRFIELAREQGVMVVWTRSLVEPLRARPSFQARGFMQEAERRLIKPVESDSRGSDWYGEMTRPLPGEIVIPKYHYDAFEDTSLDLLLSGSGIKTILTTGFTTNVCVETTSRHGYIKGYYVVVVSDCTEAPTQAEHEAAVFNLGAYFGRAATAETIERIWKA